MASQCNDIETLLPTYLDGELAPHDRLSFEHHVADCTGCRDLVRSESAYQARLRELLAAPPPPDGLVARVRAALDREDRRARAALRRVGQSWALPGAAALAAAAALVLFVVSEAGFRQDAGDVPVAKNTRKTGAGGRGESALRLPVSLPSFGAANEPADAASDAADDGGRAIWSPAQTLFDVQLRDGRHYQVRMEMLSCRNVDRTGHQRLLAGGTEVWVLRGAINRVVHSGGSNTCLVFASDMELMQLVQEVARGLR